VTTEVGAVADELYGLPPGDFTAARDRAAAQARQAGDRELAATIKKLRRPTASAWSVNRLVREQGEEVARLLEVGAALRQAQANLDADELRRLTQEGQRLVSDLARHARQAAGNAGQALSESATRELEATLHAALADPGASDAVRSGRLTAPLHYSGFGLVDIAGAVATPVTSQPARVRPEPAPASEPALRDVEPALPDVELAREALHAAEAELTEATGQVEERQRRAEQARGQQEALRQRIRQLDEEREQLRVEEVSAGEQVRAAERARAEANRRLARAEAALRRLRVDH
jgi:hypothetical protein